MSKYQTIDKKMYTAEIKGINEKEKTVDVVVSTSTKDRDGDIIEPKAFRKHLDRYKSNPILLSSHSHDSLTRIIGKAESIVVGQNGLKAKFKYFTDDGNQEADWAFKLAQKGIAAFSVGFISKAWEELEKEEGAYFSGRKFTEVELIEVSQVTVPSNPDATLRERMPEEGKELYDLACKAFGWEEKENDDGDEQQDDGSAEPNEDGAQGASEVPKGEGDEGAEGGEAEGADAGDEAGKESNEEEEDDEKIFTDEQLKQVSEKLLPEVLATVSEKIIELLVERGVIDSSKSKSYLDELLDESEDDLLTDFKGGDLKEALK